MYKICVFIEYKFVYKTKYKLRINLYTTNIVKYIKYQLFTLKYKARSQSHVILSNGGSQSDN